jgi:hypothetical protein
MRVKRAANHPDSRDKKEGEGEERKKEIGDSTKSCMNGRRAARLATKKKKTF